YELPPSLIRFLCQMIQRFRRHASHTELFDQEVDLSRGNSLVKISANWICEQHPDKAIYSASVLDMAVLFCFLDDKLTSLSPKN
ncbi:hypothetical protein Tco_0030649, partial [Tanacetum coccineum]